MRWLRSRAVGLVKAFGLHQTAIDWIDQLPLSLAALAVRLGGKKELVPSEPLKEAQRAGLAWLLNDGTQPIGDYVEFGVYQGTSLACFHQVSAAFGLAGMRLFGFDSFDGLPPEAESDDTGIWHAGQYRCSLNYAKAYLTAMGIDWRRVHLIKGWFSATARPETAAACGITRISFAMIDCDLYRSSVEALTFIAPLLHDRAVIIFDDWAVDGLDQANKGQKRAFSEFLQSNPDWLVDTLPSYDEAARVFTLVRKSLPT